MTTHCPSKDAILYTQGDLLRFSWAFRIVEEATPEQQDIFPIPAGSKFQVRFPGSPTVVVDSSVALAAEFGGGNEITIDIPNGTISGVLIPAKGALVTPSVILTNKQLAPQEVDIVMLDSLGAQIQTWRVLPPDGIVCAVRGNP